MLSYWQGVGQLTFAIGGTTGHHRFSGLPTPPGTDPRISPVPARRLHIVLDIDVTNKSVELFLKPIHVPCVEIIRDLCEGIRPLQSSVQFHCRYTYQFRFQNNVNKAWLCSLTSPRSLWADKLPSQEDLTEIWHTPSVRFPSERRYRHGIEWRAFHFLIDEGNMAKRMANTGRCSRNVSLACSETTIGQQTWEITFSMPKTKTLTFSYSNPLWFWDLSKHFWPQAQ